MHNIIKYITGKSQAPKGSINDKYNTVQHRKAIIYVRIASIISSENVFGVWSKWKEGAAFPSAFITPQQRDTKQGTAVLMYDVM